MWVLHYLVLSDLRCCSYTSTNREVVWYTNKNKKLSQFTMRFNMHSPQRQQQQKQLSSTDPKSASLCWCTYPWPQLDPEEGLKITLFLRFFLTRSVPYPTWSRWMGGEGYAGCWMWMGFGAAGCSAALKEATQHQQCDISSRKMPAWLVTQDNPW